MRKKLIRILSLLTLSGLLAGVAAGCIGPAPPPQPGQVRVKISVQPVYSLPLMSQKYSPLIDYLSRETGYEVQFVSAMSYSGYFATLESNQVDIGFQNPIAYVTLTKTRGAYPLAKEIRPDGRALYRGVIITHRSSEIKTVHDLRGKKVMIASRRALAGYMAQALLCQENGLDVEQDMKVILAGTQEEVVTGVYHRVAEAGFVREDILPLIAERIDLEEIKVIAYTDYFPTWCVAGFRNTDPVIAETVKRALLKLDKEVPEHRKILDAAGLSGFAEAVDAEYDKVRQLLDRLDIPY